MLKGKNILLGVCASIAAYKVATLIRLLVKKQAQVRVVMSPSATSFITPLTLATLSKHPVYVDYMDAKTGEWNNHVDLALWADIMLIAPLSANTLAKMAHGLCDNLLLATYLSAKAPVFVAPAMDLDMWQHATTQHNIQKLLAMGNKVIMPNKGELASGLYGEGRMQEPEEIVQYMGAILAQSQRFSSKKVLITAGPTYEKIDPVRFLGNFSTGAMGFALAEKMANDGAEVILITGTTHLQSFHPNIKRVDILSAEQMLEQCLYYYPQSDITIMAAAVADYTPVEVSENKVKKTDAMFSIVCKKTQDILKTLGEQKQQHQFLVGFALETQNEMNYALAKLKSKNLDMIVLNSLQDQGAGFGLNTNQITIIDKNEQVTQFGLKSKNEVAQDICDKLYTALQ